MTELTRRSVLAGTAAAGGATAFGLPPQTARAAAPLSGQQVPGFYRYKVGSFEVTVVTDGVNRFKFPDSFVAGKSRDEINAGLASVYQQPAKDMASAPLNPCVVNTGAKLVVIDTGTGEGTFAKSNGAAGQFHRNLKAAGIAHSQVDTVIISHFHPDHINGLLTLEGQPAFPGAEIMVPAPEWKYITHDAELNKANDRWKGAIGNARRVFGAIKKNVTPYEAGKEVVSGITAVATPGHTPGHMSHIVASGNGKVFLQADITVHTMFVRNPDWHVMFDVDPQMAEATRRKTYDMLAAEKMIMQGFHYPFPAVAHIEKTATGYREIPVPWSPTI